MTRTCSIEECDRPVIARGICRKHYSVLHAEGALPNQFFREPARPLAVRVQDRLVADGDCLIWPGHVDRGGYGKATDADGRSHWVHRVAWEAVNGPIPAGLTVDHLCRQKLCCNPEHHEIVTLEENLRRQGEANRPTACRRAGHPYPENARSNGPGKYRCVACERERRRAA